MHGQPHIRSNKKARWPNTHSSASFASIETDAEGVRLGSKVVSRCFSIYKILFCSRDRLQKGEFSLFCFRNDAASTFFNISFYVLLTVHLGTTLGK